MERTETFKYVKGKKGAEDKTGVWASLPKIFFLNIQTCFT